MSRVKFTAPRAKVPICWLCDRRLYGGGWFYAVVIDEAGIPHPAHKSCADSSRLNPTKQPRSKS